MSRPRKIKVAKTWEELEAIAEGISKEDLKTITFAPLVEVKALYAENYGFVSLVDYGKNKLFCNQKSKRLVAFLPAIKELNGLFDFFKCMMHPGIDRMQIFLNASTLVGNFDAFNPDIDHDSILEFNIEKQGHDFIINPYFYDPLNYFGDHHKKVHYDRLLEEVKNKLRENGVAESNIKCSAMKSYEAGVDFPTQGDGIACAGACNKIVGMRIAGDGVDENPCSDLTVPNRSHYDTRSDGIIRYDTSEVVREQLLMAVKMRNYHVAGELAKRFKEKIVDFSDWLSYYEHCLGNRIIKDCSGGLLESIKKCHEEYEAGNVGYGFGEYIISQLEARSIVLQQIKLSGEMGAISVLKPDAYRDKTRQGEENKVDFTRFNIVIDDGSNALLTEEIRARSPFYSEYEPGYGSRRFFKPDDFVGDDSSFSCSASNLKESDDIANQAETEIVTALKNGQRKFNFSPQEVAIAILIAIKNGGIASVNQGNLKRDFENAYKDFIPAIEVNDDYIKNVKSFSAYFQNHMGKKGFLTGNISPDANIVGMRLKRLTKEHAAAFCGSERFVELIGLKLERGDRAIAANAGSEVDSDASSEKSVETTPSATPLSNKGSVFKRGLSRFRS